jgi:DNA helicase HerA-like ATPase
MAHTLYTGITESGKTTLARYIARMAQQNKQQVFVFDPVGTQTAGGGWGDRAIIYDDFEAFMDAVEQTPITHAHLFIDEAMEHFGVGDKENHWLATRGRHKHLVCHFIAQRPKMLAPNVRTQCTTGYIFRLSPDDMDTVGEDYGHGNLSRFSLESGQFLKLTTKSSKIEASTLDKVIGSEYKTPTGKV